MSNKLFDIPIINNIIRYEETDSTNTRAKEFGNRGSVNGTLIIADCQTNGKGRLGRSFTSPSGTGIYMSLLLRPEINVSLVSEITLLAGLSVAKAISKAVSETISSENSHNVQIKWPNDVLLDNKKIAGILTEASFDSKLNYVIVGIGINVNTPHFDDELVHKATSLLLSCKKCFDTSEIIYDTMKYFNDYYDIWICDKNLSGVLSEYNSLLNSYNKDIYVIPHDITKGISNPYDIDTTGLEPVLCMGINEQGELICKKADSSTEIVRSGEVSVRGKNSYAT